MSTNFKKVLYLGASDHIDVVKYFPNCNEFVLIDTQPRIEYDEIDYFYEGFYRDKFFKKVINKCKKYGFILDETIELDSNYMNTIKTIELISDNHLNYINPHLLIFKNHQRIIKYYISTNILFNMFPILEEDIKSSDTLYVAGYHPEQILLKYINKKINFVGDNYTVYFCEPDENSNNIISNYIKKHEENISHFNEFNYYLVWRRKSMIIVCDSLEDIDNKRKQLK